jgi:hypothetical protein
MCQLGRNKDGKGMKSKDDVKGKWDLNLRERNDLSFKLVNFTNYNIKLIPCPSPCV